MLHPRRLRSRRSCVAVSTVRAFWWGVTESEPVAQVAPSAYVAALEADGYDHATDGTLPRSAGRWPAWLILALRPRFAGEVPAWARTLGVLAFRAGFADGIAELRARHPSARRTLTVTR